MVTTALPFSPPTAAPRLEVTGPVLIATDGSDASDAAFHLARQLVAHRGADASVIAVLEPVTILARDIEFPSWVREINATRRDAFTTTIRKQLREHGVPDWGFEIREGSPAVEIARAARDAKASLVVLGIGKHALRDRLFGDETALQLLRLCDVPVIAVTPGFEELPHRAILATDFSEASIRAIRTALPLLREDATIYITHAVPRFVQLSAAVEALEQRKYIDGLAGEFERLKEALVIPETMTVETMTLRGNPAHELLDFAEASKADLIVCGTHGQGFISRLLIGSVATYVVRGSPCPVLVVPQSRPTYMIRSKSERRTAAPPPRTSDLPRDQWPDRLKTFTGRNAGRSCRIEVDDPVLGAQAQVLDYPLLGVAYDHHDDRVEIMVGEQDGAQHLTRGISGVTSITLVVDEHGRDRMLRLAHGTGQTMVHL